MTKNIRCGHTSKVNSRLPEITDIFACEQYSGNMQIIRFTKFNGGKMSEKYEAEYEAERIIEKGRKGRGRKYFSFWPSMYVPNF